MKHIVRFVGRYENNFSQFGPNPKYFISAAGIKKEIVPPPAGFNGVMFYLMEDMTSGRAVVLMVMVENIKLENPVEIDKPKHLDGKGIGPRGSSIGDSSAINLLRDAIETNPSMREKLIVVARQHFPDLDWDSSLPASQSSRDGLDIDEHVDYRTALLAKKKQIILYGPPGTGKTFGTRSVAVQLIGRKG